MWMTGAVAVALVFRSVHSSFRDTAKPRQNVNVKLRLDSESLKLKDAKKKTDLLFRRSKFLVR